MASRRVGETAGAQGELIAKSAPARRAPALRGGPAGEARAPRRKEAKNKTMSRRRRSNAPPMPEKVEDAFSTETLNQLAEERMRDIKHIVVYRRRVPSRETVEADPQTVHVSLDAGGVVGRMLVDNAISPNEHEALLGCRRPASSKLL